MKNHEFSNYTLAITVVVCSAVLFIALAFALGGKTFSRTGRNVKASFEDITGIKIGSQVKYGGALAGTVTKIRFLTPEERARSSDPKDAIELTLGLYTSVPPIPNDTVVSIEADTLLSDKFVGLSSGTVSAPPIADNAVLQGMSPVTFDTLMRETGPFMNTLDTLSASLGDNMKGIIPDLQKFLGEAQAAVTDAHVLVNDLSGLVKDTKGPAKDTLKKVEDAATRLQNLSQSAEALVKNNEKDIRNSISNLNVSMQNLKVTSTYAKSLAQTLAQRPSVLIWGKQNIPQPTQEQILQSTKPYPTR